MLFYSIVAIIIGALFLIVGLIYLINKESISKQMTKKRFKNINFYVKFSGIIMLIVGALLLSSGICSFIIEKDLIFAIVFTVLLVFFFTSDFVCQKKLIIKEK